MGRIVDEPSAWEDDDPAFGGLVDELLGPALDEGIGRDPEGPPDADPVADEAEVLPAAVLGGVCVPTTVLAC